MAGPYTISVIEDVPSNSVSSILRDQRGRTLPEPSRIVGYANRETIAISLNVLVGADDVVQDGTPRVQASLGNGPIIPDDRLFDTFGNAGDEIIVRARNTDGADAREARVTIFITPVDDDALQRAMGLLPQ